MLPCPKDVDHVWHLSRGRQVPLARKSDVNRPRPLPCGELQVNPGSPLFPLGLRHIAQGELIRCEHLVRHNQSVFGA